jgi:hypothetical protein
MKPSAEIQRALEEKWHTPEGKTLPIPGTTVPAFLLNVPGGLPPWVFHGDEPLPEDFPPALDHVKRSLLASAKKQGCSHVLLANQFSDEQVSPIPVAEIPARFENLDAAASIDTLRRIAVGFTPEAHAELIRHPCMAEGKMQLPYQFAREAFARRESTVLALADIHRKEIDTVKGPEGAEVRPHLLPAPTLALRRRHTEMNDKMNEAAILRAGCTFYSLTAGQPPSDYVEKVESAESSAIAVRDDYYNQAQKPASPGDRLEMLGSDLADAEAGASEIAAENSSERAHYGDSGPGSRDREHRAWQGVAALRSEYNALLAECSGKQDAMGVPAPRSVDEMRAQQAKREVTQAGPEKPTEVPF